jgi:N-methylhydantoinase A
VSVIEAAWGIFVVVNENMVRAMRLVSVERGYDPREFTLVAFGGAGPLHAVAVAQELGIPRVLVPPSPGTLCSFGLLVTDIRTDHVRSLPLEPGTESLPRIRAIFEELADEGRNTLNREGVPPKDQSLTCTIEARYRRQNFEIPITVSLDELTADCLPELVKRFHGEHARLYGYARPQAPVEFVNYRLAAIGRVPKAAVPRVARRAAGDSVKPIAQRAVCFKETRQFVTCPIYDRVDLTADDSLVGPAIIEQMDATTLIPPDLSVRVDEFGNLLIDVTGVQG